MTEVFGTVAEKPENPARKRALLLTAMIMERKPEVLDRFVEGLRDLDDKTVVPHLWKLFSSRGCWDADMVHELVRIALAIRRYGWRAH